MGVEKFQTYSSSIGGLTLWAHASVASPENFSSTIDLRKWRANVTLSSETGEIIAKVEGLQFQKATPESLRRVRWPTRVGAFMWGS